MVNQEQRNAHNSVPGNNEVPSTTFDNIKESMIYHSILRPSSLIVHLVRSGSSLAFHFITVSLSASATSQAYTISSLHLSKIVAPIQSSALIQAKDKHGVKPNLSSYACILSTVTVFSHGHR